MTDLRDHLQRSLEGSYVIAQELGGGGMSRVFLADDVALGRRVVVKVLPTELMSPAATTRFKREITVAARLQHPPPSPGRSADSSLSP